MQAFPLNQFDNYAGCVRLASLIHPAFMRAFMMIASQSSRDTLKRSRIPACLMVFPSLDSLQPSRSSVAQSARSSMDLMPYSSTEDRVSAQAPCWSSSERGATVLRQLQLSGAKLEDTAPRGGEGRVAPGPALSNGWIHRHQPVATGRAGRRLLQQARDVRAMDQGRQGRDQVDAAVMLLVRRQRCASSASCAGLQSRQLHADAGSAGGDRAVVADQPAGKTGEDRRQGRAPWPLRHLPDGRDRGAEGIVPEDSAADRGTTATATTSACVRRLMVMR